MPALRRSTVGLLLTAGLIGAGVTIRASSGYAAPGTSLVVSPDQGRVNAQFTVTYRWPSTTAKNHGNPHACTPDQITFEWDGSLLGRATATSAGNACIAVLRTAPPPGTRQGPHAITVDTDSSVRATYTTVVARPSSAATTSTATSESTTDAAIDPQATGSQDASAPSPLTSSQAGVANGRRDEDQGGSTRYIVLGAILFLIGASALGAIVWRTRRTKADVDLVWLPTTGDTKPLALRPRTAWRPAHRRSG